MAKKKKLMKAERKEARLRKGKQWLLTYTGSPKKINKHYRERFHVDAVTAAKDLQELGVDYTQKRRNGSGWQNCIRTAMVVLLLSLDTQMAAHRMV